MRNQLDLDKRKTAERLSNLVNCDKDELAITRNTTESLDLIISGFPWEKNDEAIFAIQDYGSMQEMFKLTAKRRGIVNKIISELLICENIFSGSFRSQKSNPGESINSIFFRL